jgi:hypothetical protein
MGYQSFIIYLDYGIILIAFIESMVVIFQWLGFSPSMNELFVCTGTWVNPNVTAMFLSLSLLSQRCLFNNLKRYRKNYFLIQLGIILFAIILLQCRTAYIVAALFLLEIFMPLVQLNKSYLIKSVVAVLFITVFAFGFKTKSTAGRIQIWENCLHLIIAKPILGAGFGQFEKEYNNFVANHNLPCNDYVYMPYNDFLEIAVEGGIIAVLLWVTFLVLLIRGFKNNSYGLSLVLAFIIIQLTNFGFQDIPVFALFLIYTGCLLQTDEKIKFSKAKPITQITFKPILVIAIIVDLAFCSKLISIAHAFHLTTLIRKEYFSEKAIKECGTLSTTLRFSSNFHETYGDLIMRTGNYQAAKSQYRDALHTTSRPNVLGKCGRCYGQLGEYDSA